jgi:hypothetical protein
VLQPETKAKSPFAKKIIASADCTTKMADRDTELIPSKIGNSGCRFIAKIAYTFLNLKVM